MKEPKATFVHEYGRHQTPAEHASRCVVDRGEHYRQQRPWGFFPKPMDPLQFGTHLNAPRLPGEDARSAIRFTCIVSASMDEEAAVPLFRHHTSHHDFAKFHPGLSHVWDRL